MYADTAYFTIQPRPLTPPLNGKNRFPRVIFKLELPFLVCTLVIILKMIAVNLMGILNWLMGITQSRILYCSILALVLRNLSCAIDQGKLSDAVKK